MSDKQLLSDKQTLTLARLINIAALFALLGVLAGSLDLQFGAGELPCPLCLVQRSAMIGLAVGPAMNLLWGAAVQGGIPYEAEDRFRAADGRYRRHQG